MRRITLLATSAVVLLAGVATAPAGAAATILRPGGVYTHVTSADADAGPYVGKLKLVASADGRSIAKIAISLSCAGGGAGAGWFRAALPIAIHVHRDQFDYRTRVGEFKTVDAGVNWRLSGEITATTGGPTTISVSISDQSDPAHTLHCGADASGELYFTNESWTWQVSGAPNHANRRPVAHGDHWRVLAGNTLDANVLANDRDPDGDPITAHVLRISFAAREYSGVERGGDFLYTAGPGTTRTLRKVITYVAVDSSGARSAPARAVVTVTLRPRVPDPTRAPRAAGVVRAAAGTSAWDGPWNIAWSCFGSGIHTKCWYLLNLARAVEFDRSTSWTPSLGEAARLCLRFGILPMKNAACAKKLVSAGIDGLWDKSAIHNAAAQGSCLLYRVSRHRTFRHPLAGEWGDPEYHPLDSLVRPFDGSPTTSGWATWKKDGFTTDRWRIPLLCGRDGMVYRLIGASLQPA